MASSKSSRLALIPTEATPLPTPSQSQSPSPPPAAAAVASSSSRSTTRSSAIPVSHGFVALPVLLSSGSVSGLQETTQHIYLRRQDGAAPAAAAREGDGSDNAEDAPAVAAAAECSIFAVNLPHGSSPAAVQHGIEALLHARAGAARAAAARSASGKGKQKEGSEGAATTFDEADLRVQSVELVHPPSVRAQTLLESEGLTRPDELYTLGADVATASASASASSSKKKGKSAGTVDTAAPPTSEASKIHPLFVSDDLSLAEAMSYLCPTPSTLKAHITLSSPRAVSLLLSERSTSWPAVTWPAMAPSALLNTQGISAKLSGKAGSSSKRNIDELLYDLSRPSIADVRLHVDNWMKVFDADAKTRTGPARKAAAAAAAAQAALEAQAAAPKSRRALKRAAVEKAAKLATLQRNKEIKKRRLYDDDFADPAADADGWITVTAGGTKGRSGIDGDDDEEVEDEEDIRQAELEGFASGKRSVPVAQKAFVKAQEEQVRLQREKERRALNVKLGIEDAQADETADADRAKRAEFLQDAMESRGGGRGKKKKGTRGVEMNMYGFHKREATKKNTNDLKRRFDQDRQKIEEMKRQKRFRPY